MWNLPALNTKASRIALTPVQAKTLTLTLPEGATPQSTRILVRRQTLLFPAEAGQAYALHLGGEAKPAPGSLGALPSIRTLAATPPLPSAPPNPMTRACPTGKAPTSAPGPGCPGSPDSPCWCWGAWPGGCSGVMPEPRQTSITGFARSCTSATAREDDGHAEDLPGAEGFVQDEAAQQDGHEGVQVGVGAHLGGGPGLGQVDVGGEGQQRPEERQVGDGAKGLGRDGAAQKARL